MKQVKANLSFGFPGAERTETLEFEDNATEEEIEESVRDWAFNFIEWNFTEVE